MQTEQTSSLRSLDTCPFCELYAVMHATLRVWATGFRHCLLVVQEANSRIELHNLRLVIIAKASWIDTTLDLLDLPSAVDVITLLAAPYVPPRVVRYIAGYNRPPDGILVRQRATRTGSDNPSAV